MTHSTDVGVIGETAKIICGDKTLGILQIHEMILHIRKKIQLYEGVVGICLPRSVYLIPAIFACMQLHKPFLLIDEQLPSIRKNYMLRNSDCICMLCGSKCQIEEYEKQETIYNGVDLWVSSKLTSGYRNDSDILYHQYTSGSTGVPKGMEIPRQAMNNFIKGLEERISFSKQEQIASLTSVSFDIFLLESIVAIHLGWTVWLCDEEMYNKPRKILNWIKNADISVLQLTPSRLQQFMYLDKELSFLRKINKVLIGGEMFRQEHLLQLQEINGLEIYNLYGPAETTIWSSIADLTHEKSINIGSPIVSTVFRIMSPDLIELPIGEVGEICISGLGLAKGYINDTIQTDKVFVILDSGERIYRTGDLGVELDENIFGCFGRIDNQVKLRGYRVELEEIEQCANRIPGIKDSIAFVTTLGQSEILILAYVAEKQLEMEYFLNQLSMYMPQYMIPNQCVQVEKILLNSNGKKDREQMKQNWRKQYV